MFDSQSVKGFMSRSPSLIYSGKTSQALTSSRTTWGVTPTIKPATCAMLWLSCSLMQSISLPWSVLRRFLSPDDPNPILNRKAMDSKFFRWVSRLNGKWVIISCSAARFLCTREVFQRKVKRLSHQGQRVARCLESFLETCSTRQEEFEQRGLGGSYLMGCLSDVAYWLSSIWVSWPSRICCSVAKADPFTQRLRRRQSERAMWEQKVNDWGEPRGEFLK